MSRSALPVVRRSYDLAGLKAELERTVKGGLHIDRLNRALYSTDASVYQIVPVGVVFPKSETDIIATIAACSRFGVPLTCRGGGTSQAGQCIGPGVILDCSRHFHQILELDYVERWVRVRPGCVLDELNRHVMAHGLQFAPDISTSNRATIGGMIANNSSGTHSVVHGKTLDHVLELKAALADGSTIHARSVEAEELPAKCKQPNLEGACYRSVQKLSRDYAREIDRRFPKILRRVGGYNLDLFTPQSARPFNLSNLLVGSEGTLAVTLEAKLRLIELPKAKAVLVIQFHDLLDALAATPRVLGHGPSAVEVIDRYILDSTRLNPEASRLRGFLEGDPSAILIVEFYADRADRLPPRLEKLEADLRRGGHGYHYLRATTAAEQSRIWKLRKLALGLSMAEKGDAKAISFVEDTAVNPAQLRDYIAEFLAIVARHGTTAGVYAHASVGCLHVRPVVNLKTASGVQMFESIAAEVAELVLKYGGALSGEHGDGLVRSPFQEKMFGPTLYKAFRELKQTFDPNNVLNPGKIVDAPPLAKNLRYGRSYVTPELPTTFDFSADGGIVQAAELCAGVGECRKRREGTMCPSYQATRDELHSTRGRANTLRLALTGQLGLKGLTDPAVKEALDLCLECKACKSECPTNVDMARLKAEFLHQYHKKHGLPWRNWVFGNIDRLGWLGGSFLARSGAGRWLAEKLLGIDRRRLPPRVSRKVLWDEWLQFCESDQHPSTEAKTEIMPSTALPAVVLFADTFVQQYEPDTAIAAARLLRRAGYEVQLSGGWERSKRGRQPAPGTVCCGRPQISNGMLDQAILKARWNVEKLYPEAAASNLLTACEPSCLLTIKDDYPALLSGDERKKAEVVAAQCRTLEELLDEAIAKGGRVLFRAGPKKLLLQTHCHQQSLVGNEPALRLLRRVPGAEVIDLSAGCCGMAGSFGYEKEHYDVSRQVGELRLFPAVRAVKDEVESVVIAPGLSCRMQIEHLTGVRALHPAEFLAGLLL